LTSRTPFLALRLWLGAAAMVACADHTTAPTADRGDTVVEATIDGARWRSSPGQAAAAFNPALGRTALVVEGLRCAPCVKPTSESGFAAPGDTIEIVWLMVDTIRGPGRYAIGGGAGAGSHGGARFIRFPGGATSDSLKPQPRIYFRATGEIVVTLFDPISEYVTGTFSFTAADSSGATVALTDGRFELPLSSEVPALGLSVRVVAP
jgi:hypothetical protein